MHIVGVQFALLEPCLRTLCKLLGSNSWSLLDLESSSWISSSQSSSAKPTKHFCSSLLQLLAWLRIQGKRSRRMQGSEVVLSFWTGYKTTVRTEGTVQKKVWQSFSRGAEHSCGDWQAMKDHRNVLNFAVTALYCPIIVLPLTSDHPKLKQIAQPFQVLFLLLIEACLLQLTWH